MVPFYGAKHLLTRKVQEAVPFNLQVDPWCKEGVPMDFAVFTILAGFGASFGILYRAVTLTTGARKKRENGAAQPVLIGNLADVLWSGEKCN